MTTSPRGIALIEQFEGCKLQAYEDVASAERAVSSQVSVPLNQNQFDALVSFTFNEGIGRLQASTMLRLLNAGWYSLAAAEFPKWDIVGGIVSPGLLRRRVAEQALFTEAA